jgi:nickel/cobalt transporter (NiCoT) family protein
MMDGRQFDFSSLGSPMRLLSALRTRAAGVLVGVVALNVLAWLAAWSCFGGNTVLMGSAVLAFSLGLRHAMDADHIAAIDNATRRLMHAGKRPLTVGLWFSLGHSTVVVLLSLLLVLTAGGMQRQLERVASIGGGIGVAVSCVVLSALAVMNARVLLDLVRKFRAVKNEGVCRHEDIASSLMPGGLLGRLSARLFRFVGASWHLYPVGVLFGLGFDTATEIGLLGLSAASAVRGVGLWPIMVFPALFTAGMSLLDTADGILMLNIYNWSFDRPLRKLYYNLSITAISVAVALLVAAMEALALVQVRMGFSGPFWELVAVADRNFGFLGYAVVGLFVASWMVSIVVYKVQGYDRMEVRVADRS